MNTDPISAAIDAAVQRAIEAQLPSIIEAIKSAHRAEPEQDRFYRIKDAAELLGMSPSSIWRLERAGNLPPRERLGSSIGYRASTINRILETLDTSPIEAPKSAINKGERRRRKGCAA